MRHACIVTALVFVAFPAPSSGHRLDEYLQATRVSLQRERITLDIDLTPGANVAERVLALIDTDGDPRISPLEAESYGRTVLRDVILELDGRPVALSLTRVEAPTPEEIRHGLGTIQLRADGRVSPGVYGRREVRVRNNHQPGGSVYLVNALIPDDAGIQVVGQTRDAQQRDARIKYNLTPEWPKYVYWPLIGLTAIVVIIRRSRPVARF